MIHFASKNDVVVSYIILGQIILGIVSSIVTMFLCNNKKNHEVIGIAFFEILFSLALVILNTVYGYKNIVDFNNYGMYMEYASMHANVYLFVVFAFLIGIFYLNSYIKYITHKN